MLLRVFFFAGVADRDRRLGEEETAGELTNGGPAGKDAAGTLLLFRDVTVLGDPLGGERDAERRRR